MKSAMNILRHAKSSTMIELEMMTLKKGLTVKQFKGILEQCVIANIDLTDELEATYARFLLVYGSAKVSSNRNWDSLPSTTVTHLLK